MPHRPGVVVEPNVFFGPGIRRRLNESYKEVKERSGIVTSLPPPAAGTPHPVEPKATPKKAGPPSAAEAKPLASEAKP